MKEIFNSTSFAQSLLVHVTFGTLEKCGDSVGGFYHPGASKITLRTTCNRFCGRSTLGITLRPQFLPTDQNILKPSSAQNQIPQFSPRRSESRVQKLYDHRWFFRAEIRYHAPPPLPGSRGACLAAILLALTTRHPTPTEGPIRDEHFGQKPARGSGLVVDLFKIQDFYSDAKVPSYAGQYSCGLEVNGATR